MIELGQRAPGAIAPLELCQMVIDCKEPEVKTADVNDRSYKPMDEFIHMKNDFLYPWPGQAHSLRQCPSKCAQIQRRSSNLDVLDFVYGVWW